MPRSRIGTGGSWHGGRFFRDVLVRLAARKPKTVLLDLGCGTGGNLGALRDDFTCFGVELDREAVAFATARYPECSFRVGSIYEPATWNLPGPVDVCILSDVIEHLDDDRTALENATDALKPGGYLLVIVPADPRLWSEHDEVHEHRRRYTRATLKTLVRGLPLEVRLLTALNTRLYRPIRSWRWVQGRVPLLKGSGTTGDLAMPPAPVNRLLTWVFEGERSRVRATLEGTEPPHDRGVSLLGVFTRVASTETT